MRMWINTLRHVTELKLIFIATPGKAHSQAERDEEIHTTRDRKWLHSLTSTAAFDNSKRSLFTLDKIVYYIN